MRKKFSIIIAVLLLIGCFSGCGKQQEAEAYITSLEQLDNSRYTIGVPMGTAAAHDVEQAFSRAKVTDYSSVTNGYFAVQSGMLDAFAYSRANMEYALASGSLQGVTLLDEPVGGGTAIVAGVSPQTTIPELKQKINDFIAGIKADGTLNDAYSRWIMRGEDTMPEIPQPEHPACRLRVGTCGTVEPFSYYQGPQLAGLDIELAYRFADYLNAELEFVVLDYMALAAAAEAGTIDCIFANLNATPERAEVMDFSDPIFNQETALMVRCADSAPKTLADFDGKRIGVLTGSVHDAYVREFLPNAEPQYFSNVSDQATALVSGALDAFSIDILTARALMAENDKVTYIDEPLGYIDTAYAFGKNEHGELLCSQMNDFLARLSADGTMAELEEKWLSMGAGDYAVDMSDLAQNVPTLTFATSCSGKPNAYYYNGAPTGFEVEIAAMFCREYGYNMDIAVTDFSSIIPGINTGKYDFGADGIMITEERAQSVNFSVPDYHCSIVIVCRKDEASKAVDPVAALSATPLSELDIKTIGVLTGSIHEAIAQERFSDAKISYFNNNSDLAVALNSGLIDAFSCGEATGKTIMDENPDLVLMDEPMGAIDCSFAFGKNESGKALCDQMSEYIRKIKASGELDATHKAWNEDGFKENVELPAAPEGGRTLVFATTGETAPFSFIYNGEPTGYDVAMAADFCRAYGYGMTVETLDFTGIIPGLNNGMYDFAGNCITITPERTQSVYFSEPNHISQVVLMVKKPEISAADDDTVRVPRYASLDEMRKNDLTLGIEVGSSFETLTQEEFPKAELKYFDSVTDIANSIAAGKLDGFIVDEPVARLICSGSTKITCIEEPLETNSYACVFPKTAEGAALCEQVSEFIRRIKADGTMQQIIDAWLTDDRAAQRTDFSVLTGENGTIRMAASCEAPPFGFIRDGNEVGIDIDLMLRFCEAYGYDLALNVTNFGSILQSLGTACDIGVDGFCITPERAEQVLFSEPYYEGGTLMVIGTEEMPAAGELTFWQSLTASFEKTFIREQRWKLIVEGIGTTVFISFFSALFGTVLGFGICMLRRMRNKVIFGITTVYIRILQGTPLVVLLMVLYYLVFPHSGLSGEWVAVVAFTMNFAAYVSEMMRTGIEAVDIGQTEAALALGFPKRRAFFKFVLPQAAQHFLPVYKGEFISLVKMTSIVGYIAVQDLTKMSDIIRSRTYEAFFPLIATALIYFLISGMLSSLLRFVEVKAEPDRKNRTVKGVKMQ